MRLRARWRCSGRGGLGGLLGSSWATLDASWGPLGVLLKLVWLNTASAKH